MNFAKVAITPARLLVLALLWVSAAAAHEASIAEIRIDGADATMQVELDLVDLDFVLGIRRDSSSQLAVADVRRSAADIERYIVERVSVDGCALIPRRDNPGFRATYNPRIIADFDMQCTVDGDTRQISSRLFDELAGYRTIVTVSTANGTNAIPLQDGAATVTASTVGRASTFYRFVKEGWQHIFAGFDHLLFLLLLVLPIAREPSLRRSVLNVAGIVSAFTIAHSITLAMSTYGYLSLPAYIVEPIIAASIVVAAVLNIVATQDRLLWPVAYLFGLIHGFGFAGAFAELAAGTPLRWSDLLGFNLGVELGQLAVTIAALAVLGVVARLRYGGALLVPAGSLVVGMIGAAWFAERVF